MKNMKSIVSLTLALLLFLMVGCSTKTDASTAETTFSYSDGIDENGFWEGVKALDYVELFDYQAMQIPEYFHAVPDETLQTEIDNILASYSTSQQIADRAVVDGDTVNIDYVGSVDGVEFDNGSTGGLGTEVTIGVTSYIDDFLEQLIGHTPGETVNVEVTFPEDYHEESLQGKDALFVTKINYIVEETTAELTDDFVATNLTAVYGWTTVDEMKENLRQSLQKNEITQYLQEYFVSEVNIESVPDQVVKQQEDSMLQYYREVSEMYFGIELEEYISTYEGYSSVDEFVEANRENNQANAKYFLVIQAIAEDADFSVSDEDMENYYGTSDYSAYEEQYGLPYLKLCVLCQKVLDHVAENAVLL